MMSLGHRENHEVKAEMLSDALYNLSHTCATNQRYYQVLSTRWWWIDGVVALLVAGLTLVATLLTIFAFYKPEKLWRGVCSILASVLAMAVAWGLNIFPPSADARFYSDMFRRWSDLRQDTDTLQIEVDSKKYSTDPLAEELVDSRYRELVAKKNSLNGMEREQDKQLFEKCFADENESRTGFRTSDPNEKPRTGDDQGSK